MQERYIASADLGTSKIGLTVARVCGDDVQIIYHRETPSDGVRYSSVFNPGKASEALKAAIAKAQEELRIQIRQLVVGLPRYAVRQETASGKMMRTDPDSCITDEEIETLKSIALETYPLEDSANKEIYGAVAQSFNAEDIFQSNERDLVGATSEFLEGNFKVFVGKRKSMTNVTTTLKLAGIAPAGIYFLPDAVASAVLTDEEKENGVALIEIGAGVTSLCIYQGHIMRHYSAIPFGGRSITTDIKYECGFKEVLAENVKLAFGACMPEKLQSMSEKIIQINDEENGNYGQKLPVKYLSEIITCRAVEIIEAMLFMIQDSGYSEKLRSGIVLTGGGANLANLTGLVREMSGYKVRIGFPRLRKISAEGCDGITEASAAASVGLILAAKSDPTINCTSEPLPAPTIVDDENEEEVEPEVVQEAESYEGTILDERTGVDEAIRKQKQQKPKKQKPARKSPSTINFIWEKVTGGAGSVFDGVLDVIGDLYDSTEDDKH